MDISLKTIHNTLLVKILNDVSSKAQQPTCQKYTIGRLWFV